MYRGYNEIIVLVALLPILIFGKKLGIKGNQQEVFNRIREELRRFTANQQNSHQYVSPTPTIPPSSSTGKVHLNQQEALKIIQEHLNGLTQRHHNVNVHGKHLVSIIPTLAGRSRPGGPSIHHNRQDVFKIIQDQLRQGTAGHKHTNILGMPPSTIARTLAPDSDPNYLAKNLQDLIRRAKEEQQKRFTIRHRDDNPVSSTSTLVPKSDDQQLVIDIIKKQLQMLPEQQTSPILNLAATSSPEPIQDHHLQAIQEDLLRITGLNDQGGEHQDSANQKLAENPVKPNQQETMNKIKEQLTELSHLDHQAEPQMLPVSTQTARTNGKMRDVINKIRQGLRTASNHKQKKNRNPAAAQTFEIQLVTSPQDKRQQEVINSIRQKQQKPSRGDQKASSQDASLKLGLGSTVGAIWSEETTTNTQKGPTKSSNAETEIPSMTTNHGIGRYRSTVTPQSDLLSSLLAVLVPENQPTLRPVSVPQPTPRPLSTTRYTPKDLRARQHHVDPILDLSRHKHRHHSTRMTMSTLSTYKEDITTEHSTTERSTAGAVIYSSTIPPKREQRVSRFMKFISRNREVLKELIVKKRKQVRKRYKTDTMVREDTPLKEEKTTTTTEDTTTTRRSRERGARLRHSISPVQLDMAPAVGYHFEKMRIKNRLCQRHIMKLEGPKYDSNGNVYREAFEEVDGNRFDVTPRPLYALPICCNCCAKSSLGCE